LPFQPGNTAALRHGANSPRIVGQLALKIRDDLVGRHPYLSDERFVAPLRALCEAKAKYDLLYPYVSEKAATDGLECIPAYVLTVCGQAALRVIRYATECGLDPVGRARLVREFGPRVFGPPETESSGSREALSELH
jgi:hypothetical protein